MGFAMTVLMVGMMLLMVGGMIWGFVSGRIGRSGRRRAPRRP